jgi:hypothetical protein
MTRARGLQPEHDIEQTSYNQYEAYMVSSDDDGKIRARETFNRKWHPSLVRWSLSPALHLALGEPQLLSLLAIPFSFHSVM